MKTKYRLDLEYLGTRYSGWQTQKDRTTVQGKGFGLHIRDGSFIADKKLVSEIEALAKKKKIPFQRTMLRSGGQDGAAAQQAAAGARAVGIVVGTRYIHTVTEMLERGDLEEALVAANQIGDDAIQRRIQGYVVPESFNHGTSEQRRRWFGRGFEKGRIEACDTFNARTL